MSTKPMPDTILLLGQPAEIDGLGGLDGGGSGKGINFTDGVDPQDTATVNNVTTAVANRLIQSGGSSQDNLISYNASGEAQDSGVNVSSLVVNNIQLINSSGTTQSKGSDYIQVDTVAAAGTVTVEIRTVDINNQIPIIVQDISGAASTIL